MKSKKFMKITLKPNTKVYNIHNLVNIKVSGNGALADFLYFQLHEFEINTFVNIDLNIIIKNNIINDNVFNSIYINKNLYYARSENKFICVYKDMKLVIDSKKSIAKIDSIIVNCNFNKMFFNIVFDMILRSKLSVNSIALMHAAGVSKDSKTILLLSNKSVGKTSLTLNLVSKGWKYLSDDKIWVNSSGDVLSYPRYVVIKESNLNIHKNLFSKYTIFKYNIKRLLKKISNNHNYLYILDYLVKIPIQKYKIEVLYPSSTILKKTNIKHIIFLEKTYIDNYMIYKENIENKDVLMKIMSISNLEWNLNSIELTSAHDLLFSPNLQWLSELSNIIKNDYIVFNKIVEKTKNYSIKVPMNDSQNDITKIVDIMEKI